MMYHFNVFKTVPENIQPHSPTEEIRILGGGEDGSVRRKNLKPRMKLIINWNFQKGNNLLQVSLRQNQFCWEGMNIFWNYTIPVDQYIKIQPRTIDVSTRLWE